mmetsp:Transcript_6931/g.7920  ORF Transcript_6931/g.7920 Transcript_6931/m.7920 type:complete len:250 (+) Transcript_6931:203-952(+)|eukprot:CAMPEP_0197865128 /NCGR_PEP_ID=MMETSP1438-20131217/43483_1 /TAXON_ID=1461541 /ORGANISM="Pterosperma sp., Strain CCMP1384" /LENGTH=249 /DNA_ID=CAMNT_0043483543 /DNA_START=192 /DNA_END=941 /DNA_ORIENTATION=+
MPKSRRNKQVSLTKVKKGGKERKGTLIENVRDSVDEFPHLYVLRFKNMKNVAFKKLRDEIQDSTRFFLGSNKVMQVALGRDETDALRENLNKVSDRLAGNAGLCFTKLPRAELQNKFAMHEDFDYARPGQVATETVQFEAGPVHGHTGAPLAHTLEPTCRANGMPTRLNHGTVELLVNHEVCKEGDLLSPKACALLRLFDIKMAQFEIIMDSCFNFNENEIEIISEPDDEELEELRAAGFEVEERWVDE